jgi:hypothetical protein
MISRKVRVDPALLDGPVMDRGGIAYIRLLVKGEKPGKSEGPRKVLELSLTDTTGRAKRERAAVALFYDGSLLVAATFVLKLTIHYKDVEDARVEAFYDQAARRAKVRFATRRGAIDVTSEIQGPLLGRTPEYDEFLEAPPDEQSEVKVASDGTLELPPAPDHELPA